MRCIASCAVILALSCAPSEPDQPQPSSTRLPIFGGTLESNDPAVVLVGGHGAWCTGTLVSPKVVLTAGHCVASGTVTFVWFGRSYSNPSEPGVAMTISAAYPHPKYVTGPATHDESYDIGVVVLNGYSEMLPVPLQETSFQDADVGKSLRLVGFGDTGVASDAMAKRDVDATITAVSSMVIGINSGICHGDSGGPGFFMVGGHEVLGGVIATTANPPSSCNGVAGSLASVPFFAQWINDQIAANDPPSCAKDGRCVGACATPDPDCPCAADAGRACNDGDQCTTGETCDASDTCGGGSPTCTSPPNDCHVTTGACTFVGACTYDAKPDGADCATGHCVAGSCDDSGAPVDGACGSADGVEATTTPSAGLCSAGTASEAEGSGPWTWTCAGANGGTTASCSAAASLASSPDADPAAPAVASVNGCGAAGSPSILLGLLVALALRARRTTSSAES